MTQHKTVSLFNINDDSEFNTPLYQAEPLTMNITCQSIDQAQLNSSPRSECDPAWTGFTKVSGLIGAGLCFVLAVLGVFLPLLPTTPFVLLASYLLCRCSPGMHKRFASIRMFRELLNDWESKGGIRRSHKTRACVVVLLSSGGTLYFGNLSSVLVCLIAVSVLLGLFVILRVPLVRDAE